jgi:predicted regulator of Ras-like GTPase activity (Roadblock/LC7/MglB family)
LKDEKMEKILKELNQTPGIMGSYAFSLKKRVIANKMPPVFTNAKLLTIGKLLMKIYLAGKMSLKDVSEITLFYQESIITIREIVKETYVVVLYAPSMDIEILSMSLNLIMEDLRRLADKHRPTDLAKEENISPESDHQLKSKSEFNTIEEAIEDKESVVIDPDTLISSGPMAGVLQEMQTALTKVIGPIAKIIFTDALQKWISTDQPDFATIQGLVDILEKEINDPEKFDVYHKKVTPYIWVDN